MKSPFSIDKEQQKDLFQRSQAFACANTLISGWQLFSTLFIFLTLLSFLAYSNSLWISLLIILPLAGLLVRLFIFQHDCGHDAFFNSKTANKLTGHLLSFITTVPFTLWATEHRWHHGNQGKLEKRGVDMMNSPMTLSEAAQEHERRDFMINKITPLNVFLIGAKSLMWDRKFVKDFFMFRDSFIWPIPNESTLRNSIYIAHAGSLIMHLSIIALTGFWSWLLFIVPAAFIAAGLGSLLFWVQHNFEDSYQASEDDWQFSMVGLQGSSYLKLPSILNWFSGSIGLHHVHHLNARIPNYRLEEARCELPELQSIAPLSRQNLKDCFKKIFWNPDTQKMDSWKPEIREQ